MFSVPQESRTCALILTRYFKNKFEACENIRRRPPNRVMESDMVSKYFYLIRARAVIEVLAIPENNYAGSVKMSE